MTVSGTRGTEGGAVDREMLLGLLRRAATARAVARAAAPADTAPEEADRAFRAAVVGATTAGLSLTRVAEAVRMTREDVAAIVREHREQAARGAPPG